MHAVIVSGGKQYRVGEGDVLKLEKLAGEVGDTVDFGQVLMISKGDDIQIGMPGLANAKVSGTVLSHGRAEKVKIVKFRRRKNSRRQAGHRQYFTEVKIDSIVLGTKRAAKAAAAEPATQE